MGDILQIIRNVSDVVPNLQGLFMAVSWFMGLVFVMLAIRQSAKRSAMGPNAGDWSEPIWMFAIGIGFVAIPTLIVSLGKSIFGVGPDFDPASIFAYAPATIGIMEDGGAARETIIGIVTIVRLVSFIAVMRGLYLLNQSARGGGGGPKTFGPGFTFLIAGVIAFNFQIFVGVIERLVTDSPPAAAAAIP